MNISLLPKDLQKDYRKFKRAPRRYETELEILMAEIEEKYPEALKVEKKAIKKPVKKTRKQALNGLFHPIASPPKMIKTDVMRLPGDLGKWMGEIELYEYSMVLRGDKGAGKTRLLFQVMNAFASKGKEIGFFTLEIDASAKLIKDDYKNEYIDKKNQSKILTASECPKGLDSIREAAKVFDVVCIDSWQKIPDIKQDDFDKLRKEFKQTVFIVIFQSNTKGGTRGGNMADYDAQAVCHVKDGGLAVWEKNRYQGDDLVYGVFDGKLLKE
ncbi:hypothetical protein [Aureibacter tunicatorum]|uniref:Uncharacterized protein n=1 Tax=Aureibacter tunicatorum TaxID=866807 RepID=A0AAE3XQN7_9BACT|nr:hypothetical protein [Aureibacter tunicatorum]MDR6240978.1 hypothetical protein [Aureibacter tunicatorum]BDD03757.1 hypothetical protein AUTU_12400 [Aureibacter tunicatorum]